MRDQRLRILVDEGSDHKVGVLEATDRIDPRSEAKAHVLLVETLIRLTSLHQPFEDGPLTSSQRCDSELGETVIDTIERYHVADGRHAY
jgi:hypothetical protein